MYIVGMKVRITKWGNSLGIRLPKLFAMHLGVDAGREVDVEFKENSVVITHEPELSLDALLHKITPDNIHNETGIGSAQGKEIW